MGQRFTVQRHIVCYNNTAPSECNTLGEQFMKAIVRTRYGPPDALQFTEVEKPTPKDNEVLIKLYGASVNPLDLFSMRGAPLIRRIPGLRTPKHQILGCDIAGRVEAVGGHVKL